MPLVPLVIRVPWGSLVRVARLEKEELKAPRAKGENQEMRARMDQQGQRELMDFQGRWDNLEIEQTLVYLGKMDPMEHPERLEKRGCREQLVRKVLLVHKDRKECREAGATEDPTGSLETMVPWELQEILGYPGNKATRVTPVNQEVLERQDQRAERETEEMLVCKAPWEILVRRAYLETSGFRAQWGNLVHGDQMV